MLAFLDLSLEARTILTLVGGLAVLGPLAIALGTLCGNALVAPLTAAEAYADAAIEAWLLRKDILSLEAKRGLQAAVEDRLFNKEMV